MTRTPSGKLTFMVSSIQETLIVKLHKQQSILVKPVTTMIHEVGGQMQP